MSQLTGLLGVAVLIGIAMLFSTNRKAVRPRIVLVGFGLQLVLAFLLIRFGPVRDAFEFLATIVTKLLGFSHKGGDFIFGNLNQLGHPWGFVFAFQVLPTIVFFASLMSILYHLGVMQRIVAALAWVLEKTLGVTGTEALAAAANVFVGQTEAPLCIKPYLPRMTQSQIMLIMTGGFATIAGSVLAAYVGLLGGDDVESQTMFAKHLLTASVMSAPGAFVMAKILLPETEQPEPETTVRPVDVERGTVNILDAAAAGATDGMKLAINVAAMLIAFVALIALADWPLGAIGTTSAGQWVASVLGLETLSISGLLGVLFTPVAWLMGIRGHDAVAIGELLGIGMVATEFLAYSSLREMIAEESISPRAAIIVTYALCGFANFPSIAIQIGGLTAIAPERRSDFARLGLRAMFGGALTCWMTGCIASLFIQV